MKKQTYVYHVVPLEQVVHGKIVADPQLSDPEFLPAYRWLEREVGFFPLFLAIGNADAIYVTGYQNQWRTFIGGEFDQDKKYRKIYRKAGEYPNFVLFAFPLEKVPQRNLHDYQWWNIVLTEALCEREVGPGLRRLLFKKSWNQAKWLRQAHKDGHMVQMVAPELDLTAAEYIWVRNKRTQEALLSRGFKNVQVKRLPLEH
ncbi:MAG: hypothetical protein JSS86_02350 [Cyanobacteria bacterium SZAS LIN-2]|nr:hypothetical protein [Cyanobacteria bacterium SZAS LIN-3]MBS1995116.1 hypothetical protein [Cyanobacteria bacterium SZAS LIN-2]